jgi:glutamine synthetase
MGPNFAAELARVTDLCEAHNIHTVEVILVDTWGIPRGKRLPVAQFLRAGGDFHIANVIYVWGPRCGLHESPWVWADDGFPDLHAVPDLSSFRIAGWTEGVAVVMADSFDSATGEPIVLDSRQMLKGTLAAFADLRYGVQAATELEFYLINPDGTPAFSDIHCYSILKGAEYEPVLGEIRAALAATGIDVEACNFEYGPAQVEINMRYGPALKIADETILFKYICRQIARKHGYDATFMAKPFAGQSGSGLHIHQSLVDSEGHNVFAEVDAEGPITSSIMQRYLAGLMAHHKELQAIMTPTTNGYKRVEDYSFSPTQVTWGLDNRLVGVRSIVEGGPANRLESRWAAADANPYLVLHGTLQAGLDGLQSNLPVPPMVQGDPHASDEWERLPTTLEGAMGNFVSSPFNKRVFGETFVSCYEALQANELSEYAAEVTDDKTAAAWEFARYHDVI